MNKIVTSVLAILILALVSSPVSAGDIVAVYSCKMEEGKKKEDVHAINTKWLKWVHANVNENITSAVGTAVVGDLDRFIFVDTYPDLATWAATQTAIENDAASELEDLFQDVSECSENRLWNIEATE